MNKWNRGDRVEILRWARDRSLDEDATPKPGTCGSIISANRDGYLHIAWDNGLQGTALPSDKLRHLE